MKTIKDLEIDFDYSSYGNILDFVKDYFSYRNDSFERIKNEILNQTFDDVYFSLLKENGSPKDLRIKIRIEDDSVELIDASFEKFKTTFFSYYKNKNIAYKEYREGYVLRDKNTIKLSKDILNFYCSEPSFFNKDFYKKIFSKEEITNEITRIYNIIAGDKIPPKKDFYFVISFNYADWFLASTRNNWTSCLNLDSDYEACYWTGLPSTFLDKNRCMIYISDGTKKQYEGVKSEKSLVRSWGMLDQDDFLNVMSYYPFDISYKELIVNNFNIKFRDFNTGNFEKEIYSKYDFVFLYNKNGFSQSIYLDEIKVYDDSSMKYYSGYSSHYYFDDNGYFREGGIYEYSGGLTRLLEANSEIFEVSGVKDVYCGYTDEYYSEDEITYTESGHAVAIWYYEENFTRCEHCNSEIHLDHLDNDNNIRFVETASSEIVCSRCAEQYYSVCEHDCLLHPNDEMITFYDSYGDEFYVFEENVQDFINSSSEVYIEYTDGMVYHEDLIAYFNDEVILIIDADSLGLTVYNNIAFKKEDCRFIYSENRYITPAEVEEIESRIQLNLFEYAS